MLTGMFKTFEELEESITVEELHNLVEAQHDREYRGWKFQAGLKGIDLEAEANGSKFEEVKKRAEARLAGKTEEEASFSDFGITITKE